MHHLEEFIKQGVLRAEAGNTEKFTKLVLGQLSHLTASIAVNLDVSEPDLEKLLS
jgi:hypothetical protein